MTGTHLGGRLAAFLTATVVAGSTLVLAAGVAEAEPPPGTPPAAEAGPRSAEQAAAQAHATGKPVEATQATTGTDTLIANPDGTMTLSRTAVPSRARVGTEWKALDPTLVRNPDGSWSPKVSTTRLTLSDGGAGAMATLSRGGLSASIIPPRPLAAPEIIGDTAKYNQVLPGVDLHITARRTGGFSEVFVVQDKEAADNPELRALALPTQLTGVTLAADTAGNITGTDRTGATVLTAPASVMWDSTAAPATKRRGSGGSVSTFRGPGAGARVADVKARVAKGKIELTPDKGLLTGAKTTYPVYIDPTFHWSETGGKFSGWATVPKQLPGKNYWKDTPDPNGRMQVGNPDDEILSRTFINFPIPTAALAGATIGTATMKITQTWSYSCTPSRVNLYAPATTLNSGNANWNDWKDVNLGSVVASQNVAHGYSDNCPRSAVPFDVESAVKAALSAGKKTQTFALVAANENDTRGSWKEFLETSPTIEITYNHKPNRPTGMTTSPGTPCPAATPKIVGLGDVVLYAPVSDRNGGDLGVRFELWKTSAPGRLIAFSNPSEKYRRSGGIVSMTVKADTLKTESSNAITQFSWRVQVTDYNLTSDWSQTCSFKFDPTTTGAPALAVPDDDTTTIGLSTTITIAKGTTGSTPTAYLYQVNGNPHGKVAADAAGNATIQVTPSRSRNTVSVSGVTAGGNIGETAVARFGSNPAQRAADNDFDGDDLTDLVTPGGRNNLASGLWLASGEEPGELAPAAINIGPRGNGFMGRQPSDFDNAQIIAGRFSGTGLQDVLAYYPTGDSAGAAVILRGNGDGSPIQAQHDDSRHEIAAGMFSDRDNGLDPTELTNAGHQSGKAYPDLLGIVGSAQTGYYLSYFTAGGGTGIYTDIYPQPGVTTPTGGFDWNTWTLASTPTESRTDTDPPTTTSATTVFLWQKSTGLLYAWRDLTFGADGAATYTQQQLSGSWNTGQDIALRAADIDNNGSADLWAVGANANAVPYLTGDTGLTAKPGQRVLTANHAWLLKDAEDGDVTGGNIAKDSVGTLPLTGSGKAKWDKGELFDPSVYLDGTNSQLVTAGPAVGTLADFTVSAWVKPDRAGGVILAQDGSFTPGFKLWIDPATAGWKFSIAGTNVDNPTWVHASARPGSAAVGVWTHLSASYRRSTGLMDLHVNKIDVGSAVHTSPWSASGLFRVGAQGSTHNPAKDYFKGQIAEVLTYTSAVLYDKGNTHIRDFNGDNRTDIFAAYQDGSLLLYRGNGAGQFRPGYATIGSGWNGIDAMLSPGDFDSDGNTDLIARRPDGTLWLYRGNGAGGWLNGTTPDQIGSSGSWNAFTALFSPGDFDGDGKPDVLVRKPDGYLWLYRGNGTGYWLNGNGGTRIEDGGGWNSYRRLFSPGDFDSDGKPDMMGTEADGILKLYRGNGTGGWLNRTNPKTYGSGWTGPTALFSPGDFTGDSYTDVITRDTDGYLWLYRGNGAGSFLSAREKIGKGWNTMSKIA